MQFWLPVIIASLVFVIVPIDGFAQTLPTDYPVDWPLFISSNGLSVNPNTNTVYASHGSLTTGVVIINGETLEVIKEVKTEGAGGNAIVNPVTNTIYAIEEKPGILTIIDGETKEILKTHKLNSPWDMAVEQTKNLIYVTKDFGVTIIDGYTNEQVGSYPTMIQAGRGWSPIGPEDYEFYTHTLKGIAVNHETDNVYITAWKEPDTPAREPAKYGDGVFVIDAGLGYITNIIEIGKYPYDVAVNSMTNTIYVTNYGSNTVAVIDGYQNEVIKTIITASEPKGIVVNSNTNEVYVGTALGVQVIDGYSNTLIQTIPDTNGAFSLALNPNTNKLFVAQKLPGNANGPSSVVDVNSKQVVAKFETNPLTLSDIAGISFLYGYMIFGLVIEVLVWAGIIGGSSYLIAKKKKIFEGKVSIKRQILLAALPLGITPLLAANRVQKLKAGTLLVISTYSVFFVSMTLFFVSLTSVSIFLKPPIVPMIPFFMLVTLVPAYYIRKWSKEWNEKIEMVVR